MHLIEKAIVASSDKAYGDSRHLPYTEDMPLIGSHPYDCSKLCQEQVGTRHCRNSAMEL
ncbi:GDP-mannose 4,6-dehydratase [Microcoleus sp. OTE_8_concoct_300]|uniref:GDP-mannose 4,6-dehydratase n=1 Tax=Microcoleus sp. OTE_8_concoct_300 TaxID=2964710 RepID=UPI00403F8BEF